MSAAQHTPGPWMADAWLYVRAADGQTVARCSATLGKYELEEPNARLIAAAPELLSNLLAAANYIDTLGGDSKSYRAAIAKAIEVQS